MVMAMFTGERTTMKPLTIEGSLCPGHLATSLSVRWVPLSLPPDGFVRNATASHSWLCWRLRSRVSKSSRCAQTDLYQG